MSVSKEKIAILEEIEKMITWARRQSGMNRSPQEGYQDVCDYYYDYMTILKDSSLSDEELRICGPVVAVLQNGINMCCIWSSSGQYMAHYSQLKKTLCLAEYDLKKLVK